MKYHEALNQPRAKLTAEKCEKLKGFRFDRCAGYKMENRTFYGDNRLEAATKAAEAIIKDSTTIPKSDIKDEISEQARWLMEGGYQEIDITKLDFNSIMVNDTVRINDYIRRKIVNMCEPTGKIFSPKRKNQISAPESYVGEVVTYLDKETLKERSNDVATAILYFRDILGTNFGDIEVLEKELNDFFHSNN